MTAQQKPLNVVWLTWHLKRCRERNAQSVERVSFSKRQWFRHKQKFLDGSWKKHSANGKQIIEAEDPFQFDEDNNGVTLFSVTLAKTIF